MARWVVITTGKWEKSEQHFHQLSGRMKNGERGERTWKYATTQIRLIYVGSAYRLLLRVFPFLSLFPSRPPSRFLFIVPAWCPMNHLLKRRVRQHSPKSFFMSLDWYKRDLTTTCRKLEGNERKAKKGRRITLYLVFTHCSFSRSKHHAPTSQITPFYIPFSFYILPLCYFTFLFPFFPFDHSPFPVYLAFVIFIISVIYWFIYFIFLYYKLFYNIYFTQLKLLLANIYNN